MTSVATKLEGRSETFYNVILLPLTSFDIKAMFFQELVERTAEADVFKSSGKILIPSLRSFFLINDRIEGTHLTIRMLMGDSTPLSCKGTGQLPAELSHL